MAITLLLVLGAALGAVGAPVNTGLAMFARRATAEYMLDISTEFTNMAAFTDINLLSTDVDNPEMLESTYVCKLLI